MRFLLVLFFVSALSFSSYGEGTFSQYKAYLVSSGLTLSEADKVFSLRRVELLSKNGNLFSAIRWDLDSIPAPETLPSLEEVENIFAAAATAEAAARQSNKPIEQRQYENAFFALTEQVLTLSSDPRVGQTPPVKLGFDELNALLESLFDSDMATATKLSIKLLSIDSALKRYNTLWWDDAVTHEIPEE